MAEQTLHGVECYEAWRELTDCPHETPNQPLHSRDAAVSYTMSGRFSFARCSCGRQFCGESLAEVEDTLRRHVVDANGQSGSSAP